VQGDEILGGGTPGQTDTGTHVQGSPAHTQTKEHPEAGPDPAAFRDVMECSKNPCSPLLLGCKFNRAHKR